MRSHELIINKFGNFSVILVVLIYFIKFYQLPFIKCYRKEQYFTNFRFNFIFFFARNVWELQYLFFMFGAITNDF